MATRARGRKERVLIFGEDAHDRETIAELLRGLRPDAPPSLPRRRPLVLVKDRALAARKKNLDHLAAQARRDSRRHRVVAILAHQDADALEPAHEPLAEAIERGLEDRGHQAVGVVPAWEMEAWLYLWPDAATAVVRGWRRPARTGQRVGLIRNAKEAFARDLQPRVARRDRPRPYEEDDCPKIVRAARELGLLDRPDAVSASYDRFRRRLRALRWGS